jgi:hypothetical protein
MPNRPAQPDNAAAGGNELPHSSTALDFCFVHTTRTWASSLLLNLFIFSVLLLVMGANFILFIGWEAWACAPYRSSASGTRNTTYNNAAKKPSSSTASGDLGFHGNLPCTSPSIQLRYAGVFQRPACNAGGHGHGHCCCLGHRRRSYSCRSTPWLPTPW